MIRGYGSFEEFYLTKLKIKITENKLPKKYNTNYAVFLISYRAILFRKINFLIHLNRKTLSQANIFEPTNC